MSTLFETLQREFCPPLESSLLAALLNDIQGDGREPTEEELTNLKKSLTELARDAEFTAEFDSEDVFSTGDSSFNLSSATASSDSDSNEPFNSPLGFLQAALPHVSTKKLNQALNEAGDNVAHDIWDVVHEILSKEKAQELQERGFDDESSQTSEASWTPVEPKKFNAVKKQKKPVTKITLSDVRQQQHVEHSVVLQDDASDPWTQLMSLCGHIASFLPPYSSTYFQSYFHRPEYVTPYAAARAALSSISTQEDYSSSLIVLLEFLLPTFGNHSYSKLVSDAELCLSAAHGRGEDALELVQVLRDLDSGLEIGVQHAPSTPSSPTSATASISFSTVAKEALQSDAARATPTLPTGSGPRKHPPLQQNTGQWQKVPSRRGPKYNPPPLLPGPVSTYDRDVNGTRVVRGSGNASGKGGKGDVGELQAYKKKIAESTRRRQEMLKEASRMWQRGRNSKTRGGEVALYFAEKAKQFENQAKADAMDMARYVVESNKKDPWTIDLHGTTASEATTIVKEILARRAPTLGNPYRLITGRGSHSVNQRSVLKPAIRKALVEDGWNVSEWDGGLTVRGKGVLR